MSPSNRVAAGRESLSLAFCRWRPGKSLSCVYEQDHVPLHEHVRTHKHMLVRTCVSVCSQNGFVHTRLHKQIPIRTHGRGHTCSHPCQNPNAHECSCGKRSAVSVQMHEGRVFWLVLSTRVGACAEKPGPTVAGVRIWHGPASSSTCPR